MDDRAKLELVGRVSALYREGRDGEAEALMRGVLAAAPDDAEAWHALGSLRLVQGDLLEGFRGWEARPERLRSALHRLPYPEWTGDPLRGRSILVGGEQGIGDEIMFGRFLPELRRLGASRVSLAALSVNLRLAEQFGVDAVYPRDGGEVRVPRHDCWVMLGSLPHRLGVSLASLSGKPYLSAAPERRGGVAIVERGRPTHVNDAHRSLPPGLLRRVLPDARPIEPRGDTADSLGQVAGLDLLVTVDTSWAHMAGALGVPCWILLPAHSQDWRWLRNRDDSPWYDTVRLFRQPALGDWAAVVAAVAQALAVELAPTPARIERADDSASES